MANINDSIYGNVSLADVFKEIHVNQKEKNKQIDNFDSYMNQSNDNKFSHIMNFYNTLNDNDLFLLFSKTKIKVFSSKTVETHNISTSLFILTNSIFPLASSIIRKRL